MKDIKQQLAAFEYPTAKTCDDWVRIVRLEGMGGSCAILKRPKARNHLKGLGPLQNFEARLEPLQVTKEEIAFDFCVLVAVAPMDSIFPHRGRI